MTAGAVYQFPCRLNAEQIDALPAELRACRQWVRYRLTDPDARGKRSKKPWHPTEDRPASSTDPATWGGFEDALDHAGRHGTHGLGFVFSAADPFVGIDLDGCFDPATYRLTPDAAALVEALDSYAEVSPSGTGVHVIGRGALPGSGKKSDRVEVYDRGRFFCVTGACLNDPPLPVRDVQPELNALLEREFNRAPTEAGERPHAPSSGDWGPREGQSRHDWLRGKAVALASAGVPVAGIAPALRAWADALPGERKADAELHNLARSTVEKFGRPAAEPESLPALAPLDLAATHDEAIPWLLPDYLARGEAAILAGHAGAGKSIVALDLALAAATGTPFLGRELAGAPLRVVYVDEEQPVATVRRRVARLLRGRGRELEELGDRLRYFHQPGLDLSRPEHVELIVAAVRDHRADLVIFDSFIRFVGRLNPRDESDVATFFRGLAPLTRDLGAAVLWLHHRKKPQTGEAEGEQQFSVRGSTDLPAAVSEVFVLDKLPAGGRTLHHAKCRPAEEQPPLGVELQDDEAAGALRVVATGCAADAEDTVVNALTEAGRAGVLRSAIVTALEDAGSRDADRLTTKTLGRLHARGRAAKRQEGRSVRYWKREFAPAEVRDAEAVLRGG